MSQQLHRWWGRLAALMLAGLVVACALTACAGSPVGSPSDASERTMPTAAGMNDLAGAPAPPPQDMPASPKVERDVVKTASMTITVANPSEAADKAAVIVETADGRVDTRSEDAGSGAGRARTSVVLRVPVAKLDEVMRELKALGTVDHAETSSDDVTAQRVDLDARIKALQTSVDRLLAIMRDAKDPEALIQAENALSQRQADLDSLRAQREALGDRIEYSTVTAEFVAERVGGPAPKEYDGFLGQIERGWDGLVMLVGNLVLLFGLLLPWLAALIVVAAVVYGLVRLLRSRRSPALSTVVPPPAEQPVTVGPPADKPGENDDADKST